MLIAIDGACKRNGQPTCSSVGVAWISTDEGELLFKSRFETESTSQRGEINGLIAALEYAYKKAGENEDIIIISDSQYLCNTVMLGWCYKWRTNGWYNADGKPTKNSDQWSYICALLDKLNNPHERVFLEWTKGHCVHYTPGNTKRAMELDPSGVELFSRITTMANRPADKQNIINRFLKERKEHSAMATPPEVALDWAIANATADSIAGYIIKVLDDAIV